MSTQNTRKALKLTIDARVKLSDARNLLVPLDMRYEVQLSDIIKVLWDTEFELELELGLHDLEVATY